MREKTPNGRRTGLWRLLCLTGLLALAMGTWTGTGWAADDIIVIVNGGTPTAGSSSLQAAIADDGTAPNAITTLSVQTNGTYAFSQTDWDYITNNRTSFTSLTELNLSGVNLAQPGSVPYVPDNFLKGNTTIKDVTLPAGTLWIGENAFEGCDTLERIMGVERITIIKDNAFKGCAPLPTPAGVLQFPSVVTIGANAFNGCTNLLEFYAPSLGTPSGSGSIGEGAFNDTGLTILLLGENPPAPSNSIFNGSGLKVYSRNGATPANNYGTTPTGVSYAATAVDALSISPARLSFSVGGSPQTISSNLGSSYNEPFWWSADGDKVRLSNPTGPDVSRSIQVTVTPGNSAGSGLITLTNLQQITVGGLSGMLSYPFTASIPYAVSGSYDPGPVDPVTPVVQTVVKFLVPDSTQQSGYREYTAVQVAGVWTYNFPTGTSLRGIVVTKTADGVTRRSLFDDFYPGRSQTVPLYTDVKTLAGKEDIQVRMNLPSNLKVLRPTQSTLDIVWKKYGGNYVLQKPTIVPLGSIYINDVKRITGAKISLPLWWEKYASRILDFLVVLDDRKKVPADPAVVAAGLTFTVAFTQDGVSVTKPADLGDVFRKLSLNKIFDVDANGTPTQTDLLNLLLPHVRSGAISYNFATGALSINVPITIVDGPVPAGATGVTRPTASSKYGVVFDPAGGFVIYDGAEDGVIFDPIALMLKATISVNPSAVSMDVGGTRDVTVTGGSVTWTVTDGKVAKIEPTNTPGLYRITGLAAGVTTMTAKPDADLATKKSANNPNFATAAANGTAVVTVTVRDAALAIDLSGLGLVNDTLEIAPGEAVDLRIKSDPAGAAFTAAGLPQGLTLTSDGRLYGTVPAIGTYTVTVMATLNGESVSETFTIEVTDKGVKSGSSGGCDAGLGGFAGLVLAALMMTRRKHEAV